MSKTAEALAPALTTATPKAGTDLETTVKGWKNQQGELVDKISNEIKDFEDQIEQRKEWLKMLGNAESLGQEEGLPTSAPAKAETPGQGRGPRGDNTKTILGGVEALALAHKGGLTRPELTGLMMTEIQYNFKKDTTPEAISASVYTGGINKLTKSGTLVVVPDSKPKKYMHKKHAATKPWYKKLQESGGGGDE